MKQLTFLAIAAFTLCFAACTSNTKPTAGTAVKTVVSLPPYKAMMVTHTVADWDKWIASFRSSDTLTKAAGLTSAAVGRGLENDKWLIVMMQASDIQKAKDFASSDALKGAMANSGVTDTPKISFWNVSFDDTSAIPQAERLMVVHHVKDYATWKKAFDAEGDSTRAVNGMVLRLMAQSTDDPNTVAMLFAVTDMAKVKARVSSPEMQKVMTDAGVDGPPAISWFKWAVMQNS
jgi:quinol monooxygenase YgiN